MTVARLSQEAIEALILPNPFARISQYAFEVLVSAISTPPAARLSQAVIEVAITIETTPPTPPPPITSRYGPRLQSV